MRLPTLFRFQNSLAARFISITLLAVIAIVPIRILEVSNLRAENTAAGYASVERAANTGVDRLSEMIDQSRTMLNVVARLPTFASAGVPDCHTILTSIVVETPWAMTLSAIDRNGKVSCSSTAMLEGTDVSDRPYLRRALARKSFQLSAITKSRLTGLPTLVGAVPVEAPDSGTAAMIISIDTSWVSSLIAQIAGRQHGLAYLVQNSAIVYRSGGEVAVDGLLPADFMTTVARMDRELASEITLGDGRNYVFATREIPGVDSLLVIGIPQAELQAHALAVERNLVEDLMVAIAIIVLVFWFGHENFVRPVQLLAAGARGLGKGRFDVSFDTKRWATEFRTLATAIGSAAVDLASRDNVEKETRAQLLAQCLEDPLTGLKNRRGLDLFTETEWRSCVQEQQTFSVVAFDIDWFKEYNDHFGHAAGDEVLRIIARILQDQAALSGGLASRTGGEEFTLVLPGKSAIETMAVAEAVSFRVLRQQVPHPRTPSGIVTISGGTMSTVPDGTLAPSDVYRLADRALYDAKNAGRNRIFAGSVEIDVETVRAA